MKRLAAALIFFLVSLSCYAADPLAQFEVIIKRAASGAPPEPRVYFAEQPKKWIYLNPSIEHIKYDVKKTDSLVSPFAAWVSFDAREQMQTYATEANARARVNPLPKPGFIIHRYRLAYTYRNGAWQFESGTKGMAVNDDKVIVSSNLTPTSGDDRYLKPWLP